MKRLSCSSRNGHNNADAKRPRIQRTWQQPSISQPRPWIRQSDGRLPAIRTTANPRATQFPSRGYHPGLRMNHVDVTSPPNSLSVNIEQWIDLGVSQTIESWIRHGVPVPLKPDIEPPKYFQKNTYKFSTTEELFLQEEIKDLMAKGFLEECHTTPQCVSPIKVVPKKGKDKYRLIHDLRSLNTACVTTPFCYEDIKTVASVIQPDDQMVLIDPRKSFHHVPIQEQDREYFGFSLHSQFYRWRSLPFGWSCRPILPLTNIAACRELPPQTRHPASVLC